jgi:hypothetical protein
MSYKKIHISYNTGINVYLYDMDTDGYTVKPYNKYTFVFPDGTSEDVVLVPSNNTCHGCVFYNNSDWGSCSCETKGICRVSQDYYVIIIPISKMLEDL